MQVLPSAADRRSGGVSELRKRPAASVTGVAIRAEKNGRMATVSVLRTVIDVPLVAQKMIGIAKSTVVTEMP